MDDVEPRADAPAGPTPARATVEDARERLVELDAEIVEHRAPEPVGIGDGSVEQRGEVGDPVTAHEGRQPAALDDVSAVGRHAISPPNSNVSPLIRAILSEGTEAE